MDTLLTGIGLGFAVAAPVGPIGILCIRRTLSEGRAAGLATGFGAASADAMYGVIAAMGLSLSGVLVSHTDILRLGGGILIIILGVLSIRQFFQNAPIETINLRGRGFWGKFLSTFVKRLTNPLTILTFIGLIAGLGAGTGDNPLAPFFLVLGLFFGSAMWWLFLVQVALGVKTRLTPGVTRWLDVVSGAVLVIWGIWIVLT